MIRYAKRGLVGVSVVAVLAAVTMIFAIRTEDVATAKAADCSDVDVSFARGTNEPPGVGGVGEAFVDALTPRLSGKTMNVYAVDYPASFDFVQAGDGTNDLSTHIQQVAAACPATQFVVGGYSQGGAVVDVLLGSNPTGLTYDNPLPRALDQRIAAVALFGNPKQWQVNGINVDLSIRQDQRSKVLDLCNPGDLICDPNGGGFDAHSAYVTDGSADRAADFVVKQLAAAANAQSAANGTLVGSTPTSSVRTSAVPSSTSAPAAPLNGPSNAPTTGAPPVRHGDSPT